MSRTVVGFVIAVLAAGPVAGGAGTHARAATIYGVTERTHVAADQKYEVICRGVGSGLDAFVSRGDVEVTDGSFPPVRGGSAAWYAGKSGVAVRADDGSTEIRPVWQRTQHGDIWVVSDSSSRPGYLTIRFAVWGGARAACRFLVGGEQRGWTALDPGDARMADDADFGEGAGARANLANVAVRRAFEADVSGHLLAWLIGGYGRVQAIAPDGSTITTAGQPAAVTVNERTPGRWRFEVDASADPYDGIKLFILERP